MANLDNTVFCGSKELVQICKSKEQFGAIVHPSVAYSSRQILIFLYLTIQFEQLVLQSLFVRAAAYLGSDFWFTGSGRKDKGLFGDP